MPLIDMQCYFGVTPTALAFRPPELVQAKAYADQFGVEALAFASREASIDLNGGNARLAQALSVDPRFRGWLTLSVHQPEHSQQLARQYLVRSAWVGARFEQDSDADAVNTAGGHEIINALRRYGRPILLTISSPATLQAALAVTHEFGNLRFILAPQTEYLTNNAVPAMKENLNASLLPSVACTERDAIAQAVATIGERRVLWGSDWGRYHPAAAIGMIKDSALTPAQRERIGYRNAKELLS
jgi:predicted TIM-barrel fold metal-dependent hydrolase